MPDGARNFELAPYLEGALAHAVQSDVVGATAIHVLWIEAAPIVKDLQADRLGVKADLRGRQ